MSDTLRFAHWLRQRREALNLTQGDLADRLGCPEEAIRKLEAGEHHPSRQMVGLLAECLKIPPEELEAFVSLAGGVVDIPGALTPTTTTPAAAPSPAAAPAQVAVPTPSAHTATMPGGVRPPSGMVTFLFTDIEGSTERWEQHPDAMKSALALHDGLLRRAIETHKGYVFKTVGDAFCATFSAATEAVAATLEIHRSLGAQNWDQTGPLRVRASLHTGVADEREGDYFGTPVNYVSRLRDAGHGGQTLLSQPTYDLVRHTLPSGCSAMDLGEHKLKGLAHSERIFQLLAPDLPRDFPPLKTPTNRPNNLPPQTTALIGREKELDAVTRLLARDDVRLVTLTGPGGVGKTRLALQAAAELVDDFGDGVFLVSLAPISDPGLVASTIAQTLGLKDVGNRPPADTLKDYLRDRHMLLLVDNYEQLATSAPLLSELLAAATRLKLLVTSRASLHLYAEHEYPVAPMELPSLKRLPPLEELAKNEAIRLFTERAAATRPDFELTEDNARPVAEICCRLDGLPLAIELAAARIRLFAPETMLARLESRLKLLTGGARDMPARQQTLRSTIGWSYDLLEPSEKLLFTRLAVFVGGCTLEAAEVVCSTSSDYELDVLEGVTSLLDKSLLRQQQHTGQEERFGMLETVREFGLERLAESGEEETVRQAHAVFFLQLAETAEPKMRGSDQKIWLQRLEEEHDNLRAALRRAGENGQAETEIRLANALWRFWWARGHLTEGRQYMAQGLAKKDQVSPSLKAMLLYGAGRGAMVQGDYGPARSLQEESLAVYRELQDNRGVATVINELGLLAGLGGDYSGKRSLHEQSLQMFRDLGYKRGIADSLFHLANAAMVTGDLASARQLHEQSLALQRELGDKRAIALTLYSLSNTAFDLGDLEPARAYCEEGLAIARDLGDNLVVANLLISLGSVARSLKDYSLARSRLEEGLVIYLELGVKRGIADSLARLGHVGIDQGDHAAARPLLEQSLAMRQNLGNKSGIAECLERLAEVWSLQGQPERAARLFGAAEALRSAVRTPLPPADVPGYDNWVAEARSQLGEDAFAAAWAEGREMDIEQAIAYALGKAALPAPLPGAEAS